jgi:WD40 repeat protein
MILWDLTNGEQALRLQGHWNGSGSIAVSADGHRLASASRDEAVKTWEVSRLACKKMGEP